MAAVADLTATGHDVYALLYQRPTRRQPATIFTSEAPAFILSRG
jgi:hypothetical protein